MCPPGARGGDEPRHYRCAGGCAPRPPGRRIGGEAPRPLFIIYKELPGLASDRRGGPCTLPGLEAGINPATTETLGVMPPDPRADARGRMVVYHPHPNLRLCRSLDRVGPLPSEGEGTAAVGEGLVPSLQRVHNSPYPSYLKRGNPASTSPGGDKPRHYRSAGGRAPRPPGRRIGGEAPRPPGPEAGMNPATTEALWASPPDPWSFWICHLAFPHAPLSPPLSRC